jgi:hypothetical protein
VIAGLAAQALPSTVAIRYQRPVSLVEPGLRQVTVQGHGLGAPAASASCAPVPLESLPCNGATTLVAVKIDAAGERFIGPRRSYQEPVRRLHAGREAIETHARPLLDVRHLRVEFPTRVGRCSRSTTSRSRSRRRDSWASSASRAPGKSLTGAAIIGLLDPPGRIAGGEIRFDGRRIDNLPYEEMRGCAAARSAPIFQDPLTSLDPLYTIGQQLIETIQTHLPVGAAEARRRACGCSRKPAFPPPRSGSTSIRTSSRAACGSGS